MHDGAVFVSDEEAGADGYGRELIEEVVEEDFFEGVSAQFCEGVYLGYEVLVFELVFGVPLNAVVEAFGDGQKIDELHEARERFMKIFYDWSPSHFWGVVE